MVLNESTSIYTSPNGEVWTERLLPDIVVAQERVNTVHHNGLAGVAGKWIIFLGFRNNGGYYYTKMYVSIDGLDWTREDCTRYHTTSTVQRRIAHNHLAAPNGLWVRMAEYKAFGSKVMYWTSTDGTTWVEHSFPYSKNYRMGFLTYFNNKWILSHTAADPVTCISSSIGVYASNDPVNLPFKTSYSLRGHKYGMWYNGAQTDDLLLYMRTHQSNRNYPDTTPQVISYENGTWALDSYKTPGIRGGANGYIWRTKDFFIIRYEALGRALDLSLIHI